MNKIYSFLAAAAVTFSAMATVNSASATEAPVLAGANKVTPGTNIEGTWKFTGYDQYMKKTIGITYTAAINGEDNVVFTASGDAFNLIADYDSTTGVLTFSQRNVGYSSSEGKYIFQMPYKSLDSDYYPIVETITAQFDPRQGTIVFDSGNGIGWCGDNYQTPPTNPKGKYYDVLDYRSFVQTSQSNPQFDESDRDLSLLRKIQGEWQMDGRSYWDGNVNYKLNVTVDDEDNVIFTSSEGIGWLKMIGTFNWITGKLEFRNVFLQDYTNSNNVTYKEYQRPFLSQYGINDLTDGTVQATYDPEEGKLTFPSGNGIALVTGSLKANPGLDMITLYSLTQLSQTYTEPEEPTEGNITGTMTAQADMNAGADVNNPDLSMTEPETFEVTATYDEETQSLTIYNFADMNPITFVVDLATGNAVATDQVAKVEDWDLGEESVFYYSDVASYDAYSFTGVTVAYATVTNEGENQTKVTVKPWGPGFEFPDFGFLLEAAYFNTEVLLDFTIPGLENASGELPELPEVDANPAIEGKWTFNLNAHYEGEYSLNEITENYEATIDGSTVTFTSESGWYEPIVGVFTAENTITFTKQQTDPEATWAFKMYQVPFVNETSTDDPDELTFRNITAEFDPEAGTLTFADNSGMGYGQFGNDGANLDYWDIVFDFVSAAKSDSVEPEPEATITVKSVEATPDVQNSSIAVRIAYQTENLPESYEIKAIFSELNSLNDRTFALDASPATVELTNLTGIEFTYNVVLHVTDASGSVLAASGISEFTVKFDSAINGIEADLNGTARYYNLQGVEITNPAAGTVVIKVTGTEAAKVVMP